MGRGRAEGIMLRLQQPLKNRIDDWIAAQPEPKLSRPEAIRQLVEIGLGKAGKREGGG